MTDRYISAADSISAALERLRRVATEARAFICRVLCRYYMHGTCRYGKECQFSHDISHDMPSMVCYL